MSQNVVDSNAEAATWLEFFRSEALEVDGRVDVMRARFNSAF